MGFFRSIECRAWWAGNCRLLRVWIAFRWSSMACPVHEDDRASREIGKRIGIGFDRSGQLFRRRVERPGVEPQIPLRDVPPVQDRVVPPRIRDGPAGAVVIASCSSGRASPSLGRSGRTWTSVPDGRPWNPAMPGTVSPNFKRSTMCLGPMDSTDWRYDNIQHLHGATFRLARTKHQAPTGTTTTARDVGRRR